MNDSRYVIAQAPDVIRHISSGQHAFIGCDDPRNRNSLVLKLSDALTSQPIHCLQGAEVRSYEQFSDYFLDACQQLAAAIGQRLPSRKFSLHTLFNEVVQLYINSDRQGYLIINDVDPIIRLQHSYEIEGALRSVMQFHSDIAVVLCGSNKTIDGIGRNDRPFYLSFRVFRL